MDGTQGGPTDCTYTGSPSGFVDTDIFESYIKNLCVEIDCLRVRRRAKPETYKFPEVDVIFTDGHSSRENTKMIDDLVEQKIHLFKLPSHLTHLYQPLDLLFFSQFKLNLQNVSERHQYRRRSTALSIADVPSIIRAAYEMTASVTTIKSSFNRSALYPPDPMKIISIMQERLSPKPPLQRSHPSTSDKQALELAVRPIVEKIMKEDAPIQQPARSNRRISVRNNGRARIYTAESSRIQDQQESLYRILKSGSRDDLCSLCVKYGLATEGTKKILRCHAINELKNLNLIPNLSELNSKSLAFVIRIRRSTLPPRSTLPYPSL